MSCSNFFRENKERGSNIGFVVGAKHVIDWRHLSLSVCPSIRSLALVGQNFYGLLIILIRPFSNATNAKKCIWFWTTYIHFWKKYCKSQIFVFIEETQTNPGLDCPRLKNARWWFVQVKTRSEGTTENLETSIPPTPLQ